MYLPSLFLILLTITPRVVSRADSHLHNQDDLSHWPESSTDGPDLPEDTILLSTRQYWMNRAIAALADLNEGNSCPLAAFGAVVVNHSAVEVGADDKEGNGAGNGREVCIGANSIVRDGNPTLHGEIAAINNCTKILTDPEGEYKLSGPGALKALGDLSLYTTAEACPMCTSAILYGGFKEYIYSTSIPTLRQHGWPQIAIRSTEVFNRSVGRLAAHRTRIMGDVLADETEGLFRWQFGGGDCPQGCHRGQGGCMPGHSAKVMAGRKNEL